MPVRLWKIEVIFLKSGSNIFRYSTIFNYFIKNYSPINIISYSDLSRGNGELYLKLGFNKEYQTNPNYYWIIDNIKVNNVIDNGGVGFQNIVNHKKGNYLKSTFGNNGMFDMNNPNIYKTIIGGAAIQQLNKNKDKK